MGKIQSRFAVILVLPLLLGSASLGLCAEGLKANIENVTINSDLKAEVTFTLHDSQDQPLTLEDVSTRFILARLDPFSSVGTYRYSSYTTREQVVPEGEPNAGASAPQATYDTDGTYTQLENGKYVYVFNTPLPADYDQTKTHTVSAQMERESEEGDDDEKTYYANPLYHFVPDGSEVTALRKVATTESCNACHNGMGIHGGGRRDVGLCITCHSPQSTDPDTGNSVDMTEMIHKIHMGANLPSVQAGGSYEIVGYRQSVHDYSDVVFPTDIRNCEMCHTGEDAEVYKTAPSRMACGSCHDDIDFAAGEGHFQQTDDSQCANCHQPEGNEFDSSVAGAHTIPVKSQQLNGLTAEILEVTNAEPGQQPTVRYQVIEDDGTAVDPSTLRTLAITYAAPVVEYTGYNREDATTVSEAQGDGSYTYTFQQALPQEAQTTYAFAIEARRNVDLSDEISVTEAAINPVFFAPVGSEQVSQRREIVATENCNACHERISLHGSLRNNLDYCVTCHNPKVSDIEVRPEEVGGGESVSFGYMIHKIHRGHNLDQGYTVYGYGSREHDYSHVLFPGKNHRCEICHVGEGTDAIPSLPLDPIVESIDFEQLEGTQITLAPTMAACTSCHDSEEAISHANQYVDGETESCDMCHAAGGVADITQIHVQKEFLNVMETIAPPDGTDVNSWWVH